MSRARYGADGPQRTTGQQPTEQRRGRDQQRRRDHRSGDDMAHRVAPRDLPILVVGVENLLLLHLIRSRAPSDDRAGGLGNCRGAGVRDGATALLIALLNAASAGWLLLARSMLCRATTAVIAMSTPPASRKTAENVRVSLVRRVRRARWTVTPGTPRRRPCRRPAARRACGAAGPPSPRRCC